MDSSVASVSDDSDDSESVIHLNQPLKKPLAKHSNGDEDKNKGKVESKVISEYKMKEENICGNE